MEEFCEKFFFAHLIACEFTEWLYSKSVFQGDETNATNPSRTQMYLLLNVAWLLVAWGS